MQDLLACYWFIRKDQLLLKYFQEFKICFKGFADAACILSNGLIKYKILLQLEVSAS